MTYTVKTQSYNDRRYGKPWLAFCTTSLTKDFDFIDWDGDPGLAGEFVFDAEPGAILADGQKDRKGRGGVTNYYICLPDGRSVALYSGEASRLHKLGAEKAWRAFAEMRLAHWVATNESGRFKNCARYAKMLGIDNPALTEVAMPSA